MAKNEACPERGPEFTLDRSRYARDIAYERNEDVIEENRRLVEAENPTEFEPLRELAQCLAGLPLALAQAGSYIRSHNCSFSKCLRLYRDASKKSEFDSILRRTEEEIAPVGEEQRRIFSQHGKYALIDLREMQLLSFKLWRCSETHLYLKIY